jgi:hypothetical protein
MTPREIIAQSLFDFSGSGQGVDDMLEAIAFEQSHAIFNDLKTAGFTIIHDSENHGPTRDRAAEVAETCPDTPFSESRRWHGNLRNSIPKAIRTMEVKP